MEIIETILGIAGFAIIIWHILSAYGFRNAVQKDNKEVWSRLGNPNPLAFFWWDLKRFKTNHESLFSGNQAVQQSFKRFSISWKFGMPALVAVAVINEIVEKL